MIGVTNIVKSSFNLGHCVFMTLVTGWRHKFDVFQRCSIKITTPLEFVL